MVVLPVLTSSIDCVDTVESVASPERFDYLGRIDTFDSVKNISLLIVDVSIWRDLNDTAYYHIPP